MKLTDFQISQITINAIIGVLLGLAYFNDNLGFYDVLHGACCLGFGATTWMYFKVFRDEHGARKPLFLILVFAAATLCWMHIPLHRTDWEFGIKLDTWQEINSASIVFSVLAAGAAFLVRNPLQNGAETAPKAVSLDIPEPPPLSLQSPSQTKQTSFAPMLMKSDQNTKEPQLAMQRISIPPPFSQDEEGQRKAINETEKEALEHLHNLPLPQGKKLSNLPETKQESEPQEASSLQAFLEQNPDWVAVTIGGKRFLNPNRPKK